MKSVFFLTIAAIFAAAFALQTKAQTYQSTPDIIYGQRCYVESNYRHVAHGDKNGTSSMEWPSINGRQVVYYLHVPEGYTKLTTYITPKTSCSLRLTVTDPETEAIVYDTEVGASGTKSVGLEMMKDFSFPADKWYRFEFSTTKNSSIASIDKLEFYRQSTKNITSSGIFMAPSTHLWTTLPTDPAAPTSESYDWAYEEVMYPSIYERGARYVEAINTMKGYMGIQYTESGNRNVIFSMWDNGDTDKDPNLPDYLRSGFMDGDPRLTVERFKGEGTGQKTIFEHGQYYRPDTWVQFLFNARPEIINVTLKGSKGQDSIITYRNSITSAWYKMADDKDWTFISTIRSSGAPTYFYRWCSFLENFGDNGCEYTRAYYRKCYLRAVTDGKWYNINHFTFGHTQGTSARNSRSDYGHGVTDIYNNAFYMEHGAYTTRVNDSSQYAGIPLDQSCVDTINIDAKNERINRSVLRNNKEQTITRMQSTGETYDLSKWEVIGWSDQEEDFGDDGRAYMAVDGNSKTYWQNKWRNGGVMYPHWIALKAPSTVSINQIDLTSSKTSYLYWPKSLVVHTSEDGENWTVATDTIIINKSAKSSTHLPQRVTSKYFKIEFVDAYGAMLVLNEMGLSTDSDPTKIMDYARELIENANRFDSYREEDLEPLKEVYDNGNGDPDKVSEAIVQIASTAPLLKYGGLSYPYHISSMCTYQLCNYKGYGKLIIDGDKPSIGEATTEGALDKYKNKVDVTQLLNNWMIIRNYQYSTYYLYNPGLKKYLDLSSPTLLSDEPASVTLNYRYPELSYYIKSGGKYLCLDPESASQPIKAVISADDKCYFMLYSNHYLLPKQDSAKAVAEECDNHAKFGSYVTKLEYILNIPEGCVGRPTDEARAILQNYYTQGPTIENRQELYDLVDNYERIPYDPTTYCYRIKSATQNGSKIYYSAKDNSTASAPDVRTIEAKEYDANSPEQIWAMRPHNEGLSLSAQDVVLGRLPDYSGYAVPLANKKNRNDFGRYYVTERRPGTYMFSNCQNGGITLASSTSSFGYTASFNENSASMRLEIAESINVSLNEAGMRGVNYNFDVIVPEDLAVYVVDHLAEGTAYFLRVYDRLPAGTPAVIRGEANADITLQIAAPTISMLEGNMLKGTYYAKNTLQDNSYVLSTEAGGKFMPGNKVGANGVYLQLTDKDDTPTDGFLLDFSDEPAAANDATSAPADDNAKTYNLQGQEISAPAKGQIYIKNGKKVKK